MATSVAQRPAVNEVVRLARFELERGAREEPLGSNAGADVRRYLRWCVRHGMPLPLTVGAWCAGFASWCVWGGEHGGEHMGPADALGWAPGATVRGYPIPPVGYRAAVAELVDDARASGAWHGMQAALAPLPGDLLVMRRDGHDPTVGGEGHVEIVEDEAPGGIVTIGGNVGNRVARMVRTPADGIVGWISIGAYTARL